MSDRYDICVPRKGNDGKTRWMKIGVAFPARSGDGINLIFDALPLPDAEGRCAASLFRPKEKSSSGDTGESPRAATEPDDDKEIPF